MLAGDPVLSANGAYLLCGAFVVARAAVIHGVADLSRIMGTTGFAELSARTGRLITMFGGSRGYLRMGPKYPPPGGAVTVNWSYLYWASPDGRVLIGDLNGHAVALVDGHARSLPWLTVFGYREGLQEPGVAW
jgi:hypothetical protein